MKRKNCLLLVLSSLFLFELVKAPEVGNVAETQEEASNVESTSQSQAEALGVENVVKLQVEAPNVEHIAKSQAETLNVEDTAQSQIGVSEVENVIKSHREEASEDKIVETPVETFNVEKTAASQIEASEVENVSESQQGRTSVENIENSPQEERPNVENVDTPHLEKGPDIENVALLQSYTHPEKYNVYISIFNEGNIPIFTGRLKIQIRCLEDTDKVVLNAQNMKLNYYLVGVSNVRVKRHVTPEIIKTRRTYFAGNRPDIFVMELAETLKKGVSYNVSSTVTRDRHLEYAETRKQILYNYTYDWDNNDILEIIFRIGPNKASLLFPCFCERNVKSIFRVEMSHYANVVALSNWPVSVTKSFIGDFPDQTTTIFEETAFISPSGLSFAVTASKSTDSLGSAKDRSGPPIRIWADEKWIRSMGEAQKVAEKAMKFYLDYFKVPLYASKLDIIAASKLQKGDTEKLGLINLPETSLVYFEADVHKYFHITRDLCFAISGQWLGSSVTMSDLKESYFLHALAHYLEQLCLNKVNPGAGFDFYNLRNFITFSRTLMPDYETKLYSEFDSIFNHKLPTGDTQKALQLVRMLVFILSERTLHNSLMTYLKKNELSFSNLDKLWEILTTEADTVNVEGMPVEKIINTWIEENEFPLLRVEVNYTEQTITLSQEPFKFLGEKKEEGNKVCWNIRLSYVTRKNLKFVDEEKPLPNWLTCEKSETFKVDLDFGEWIIVNPQLDVPGHTYLDGQNWEYIQRTLLNPLTFLEIDELTRAHLVLDLFALAAAGVVPYHRVFHTMTYLKHEISKLCWITALAEFDKMYSYLLGTTPALLKQFQNYVKEILDPVFNSVSSDGKSKESPGDDASNKELFDQSASIKGTSQAGLGTESKTSISEPPANIEETSQKDLDTESKKLSDQPVGIEETPHDYDIKPESEGIAGHFSSTDDIKPDDRLKENKKYRKLFDEPVKIDEILRRHDYDKIQEDDKLNEEFIKLFVRSSCKFGVAECINQSKILYEKRITSITGLDPDIKKYLKDFEILINQNAKKSNPSHYKIPIEFRDTVLCSVIQRSSEDVWKREWNQLERKKTSKENDIILKALGCFEEDAEFLTKKFLKKTLKKSYQGNNLKAFVGLSSNIIGYSVMKNFLTAYFDRIKWHLKSTNGPEREPVKIETYFAELFNVTTKQEDADELAKFMEIQKEHIDRSDEILQKSIKKANANILWLQTHQNTWAELLKNYDSK